MRIKHRTKILILCCCITLATALPCVPAHAAGGDVLVDTTTGQFIPLPGTPLPGFSTDVTIVEDNYSLWSDRYVYSEHGNEERTLYRISQKIEEISDTRNRDGWIFAEEVIEWGAWSSWEGPYSMDEYYNTLWGKGSYYDGIKELNGVRVEMKVDRPGNVYRTRRQKSTTRYKHYKWGDWSQWSETVATQTDSKKVETKKQYRSKLFAGNRVYRGAELLSPSEARIYWDSIDGASGYYVYQKRSDTYAFNLVGTATTNEIDVTLNGAGDYSFYIRPYKEFDGKAYVGSKIENNDMLHTFDYVTKPMARLTGQNTIHIDWNDTAGATGYEVFYKGYKASKWRKKSTSVSQSILNIKGAKDKYEFRIRPYYRNGNKVVNYPGYSETATYTFMTKNNLKVTKNSSISVKLTWNGSKGEKDGYEIYRAASSKGKYKAIKKISASASKKAIVVQKQRGKRYYYKIRAYKIVNSKKVYGPYSNVKSFRL